MKLEVLRISKASILLQLFLIYAWLTNLAVLSVTDTYFSVYILVAVAGVACLFVNYYFDKNVCGGGTNG